MLTYEQAITLFTYENGKLLWRIPGPKRNIGKPAGHTDSTGYTRIMIAGKMYLAHRIIWLMHKGEWPKQTLDHIDGNQANNKIENLRDISHSGNMRTAITKKDNKTCSRGISFNPRQTNRPYSLRLQGNYLGSFSTIEEAQKAKEEYVKAHTYS